MSAQKSNGPIIDPALCRCCRAIKKCRILTAEYTWMGKKEVYADMVMDCYGILLSHVDDNEKDSGVCATCVVRLREATAFRHQVLQCEQLFLQAKLNPPEADKEGDYEIKLKQMELELKTEPKDYNSDHNSMDGDHDAGPAYSEDDAEDNKPLKPEEPKPEDPPVLKKDEEVKSEESEDYNDESSSDSDEPIKKKAKRKSKAKANGAKKKPGKTAKKQKADTDHTDTPGLSTFIAEPVKMEFTAETSGDESIDGVVKVEFTEEPSYGDSIDCHEYIEFECAEMPEETVMKKKRPWVREKDNIEGYNLLCAKLDADEELYFKYFNMSKSSFEELHDMVEDLIIKEDTQMRKSVTTKERLMICLRYYRTGHSYRIISEQFGVGTATVSNVIKEVSRALWGVLQPLYMPAPREHTWQDSETGFRETFNFPNCVGSIGGRHIIAKQYQIQETDLPKVSDKARHKRLVTIALLMVTDPFNKILALDIGNYAKDGDTGILENSKFYGKYMLKKEFLPPKPLPGDTKPIPHVVIGDHSFYLRRDLMRPYPKNLASLDQSKRKFNKWLERAATVDKTFELLMECWGALDKPMDCQIETAVAIMKALCCLHNYILAKHGTLLPCDLSDRASTFDRPKRSSKKSLKFLKTFDPAKARSTHMAMTVREEFTAYINQFDIEGTPDDPEDSFQGPNVSTNDAERDDPEDSFQGPKVSTNDAEFEVQFEPGQLVDAKSFDDPI